MNVEPVSKVLEPWLERACQTLGTILGQGVQAGLAQGEVTPRADLEGRLPPRFLAFPCSFAGTLPGQLLVVLSHQDAGTLVNLLSGGDGTGTIEELTGLHTDVLAETMQQVVAALPGALHQTLKRAVQVRMEDPRHGRLPELGSSALVHLRFPLFLSGGADLELQVVLPETTAAAMVPAEEPVAPPRLSMVPGGGAGSLLPPPPPPGPEPGYAPAGPRIERPHFESVDLRKERTENPRLDTIMDVPLKVTVVLGRTEVTLGDLVSLGEGSVLELDKLAGENVELYVRDRLVAYGEVIVVEERFGVKIVGLAEDRAPQFRSRLRA